MQIPVYIEAGSKRSFACAVEWPGWSRSGRDEESALQALLDYGPRYAAAIRTARLGFQAPKELAAFKVLERLKGDTTTDFGAPGAIPKVDKRPTDDEELRRLQAILKACWRTFDAAVADARGKTLRTGARGGGRDQGKIVEHVLGAERGYLYKLQSKKPQVPEEAPAERQAEEIRKETLRGMAASAHGEVPMQGPRGGLVWPVRYFTRRSAWHVLDHAWEIEDRAA